LNDLKAYIETGVLELYVLGQLTLPEEQEIEAMAAKHSEIKEEISNIELVMEKYALLNAIAPVPGIAEKIFSAIHQQSASSTDQPADAKVIQLQPGTYESKIRTLRYTLVACITLLIISTAALFSAHSKLNLAHQQIASLSLDKEKFAATVSFIEQNNAELQKIADMAGNSAWKIIHLSGTKMAPAAKLMVYWHASGKHVMINNAKMELPENDQEHQYQLWALVNGKPVDLGVFDMKKGAAHMLRNMKEIGAAQTFAVTLEKRGGSISPTLDQMVAAGNVTI